MNINVVSCSGANEHTELSELFKLVEENSAISVEIGVPVSGSKASFGSARYWWLKTLYFYQQANKKTLDLSLHLYFDWVERFCKGDVPAEVDEFLSLKNYDGTPFIGAIQLNFKVGRERKPILVPLIEVIENYPDQIFVLSYNDSNAEIISQLRKKGTSFDLLYDDSFGSGILPEKRMRPIYDDVLQGYAGGFSPENVYEELNKLNAIVPKKRDIFIDAEGQLKGAGGYFSVERADKFIKEVVRWLNNH